MTTDSETNLPLFQEKHPLFCRFSKIKTVRFCRFSKIGNLVTRIIRAYNFTVICLGSLSLCTRSKAVTTYMYFRVPSA